MKKIIALSALAAMMATSVAHAASTGTITFDGALTATTCDATVNGGAASSTVTLPTVSNTTLPATGDRGQKVGFDINLSSCAGTLTTASAFFGSGPDVDTATGRLINRGTAANVQLELADGSGTRGVIKVGDSSQITDTTYVDIASGSAALPYTVNYYATGAAGAGTVSSTVMYSIQYK